jgi:hypothetical protein
VEHASDRVGDLARREARRGDLVEQRLEDVVVGAVQNRDVKRGAVERASRVQASESPADDDYAGGLRRLLALPKRT